MLRLLTRDGTAIHGDKQQNERDWVLDQFKTGKSPIMVATDVASRGIGMYHLSLPSRLAPLSCCPLKKRSLATPSNPLLYFTLVSRGSLPTQNLPELLRVPLGLYTLCGVLVRCVVFRIRAEYRLRLLIHSCTEFR